MRNWYTVKPMSISPSSQAIAVRLAEVQVHEGLVEDVQPHFLPCSGRRRFMARMLPAAPYQEPMKTPTKLMIRSGRMAGRTGEEDLVDEGGAVKVGGLVEVLRDAFEGGQVDEAGLGPCRPTPWA